MTHIVREPERKQISGLCNMQCRRLEAEGNFPKRFKLNPDGGPFGAVGWDFDELMAWIASRRGSRGPTAALVVWLIMPIAYTLRSLA